MFSCVRNGVRNCGGRPLVVRQISKTSELVPVLADVGGEGR